MQSGWVFRLVDFQPDSVRGPMSRKESIRHHADRAFQELDRARSAVSEEAAMAHLELSELHLEKMHALTETPGPRLHLVRD
jgi:hypothetical protein